MDRIAGRIGQLPGSLEETCAVGVPGRAMVPLPPANNDESNLIASFIAQRSMMNHGSGDPNSYPNRFLDMHADAGFGLHALILFPMTAVQRDEIPDSASLEPQTLELANGHNIPFFAVSITPENLRKFSVKLPGRIGELHNSFVPRRHSRIYIYDVIFAQTLIAKQISYMVSHAGIGTQYASNLGHEDTFAHALENINSALGWELTSDYSTILSDSGLSPPITLGQLIFWIALKRTSELTCEYRLMIAFLNRVTDPSSLCDGARTRQLIESFRRWVNNPCSSCFLVCLTDIIPNAPSYFPFTTTSILDHPNKMYFIDPSCYHAIQLSHEAANTTPMPSYWVFYPMFEHTNVFVSASNSFSTLRSRGGAYSTTMATYLIVTFDIMTTRIVRIVRAAKAGRFFPLVSFFREITLNFQTTNRIRDIILCMITVMRKVPDLTSLIRNLITILFFSAIPRELLNGPWDPTRDIHRESILQQIASVQPIVHPQLQRILGSQPEDPALSAILDSPTRSSVVLSALRAEFESHTERIFPDLPTV